MCANKEDAELGDTTFRTKLMPLALMLVSPLAVQLAWVVCYRHSGSVSAVWQMSPTALWRSLPGMNAHAAAIVVTFLAMQLALLRIVPGPCFRAMPTPMGNRPIYKLNGVRSFVITHAALAVLYHYDLFEYSTLYHTFGHILAFLNDTALVITLALYVKGIRSPTSTDSGRSGHGFIWDIWHGTELHPELFGVSLKQLINCRFAMMGWSVAVVAFTATQYEKYGFVSNSMLLSTILQLVYVFKFFMWESGYFNSVDIIHDRFGFYIFWGCSAFLPSIYTLTSYYLTTHPIQWTIWQTALILTMGLISVACNYWTDMQRQHFRAHHGNVNIWGKEARIVHATYTTGDGKKRESLLLASGWWGLARHINYVFEILLALCWSVPAGRSAIIAYVYVIFLSVLLTDRAYRDELRCQAKYGRDYDRYCALVPFRMLPGVY